MRYIKSTRVRKYDGQNIVIYLTLTFTLVGFIIQFIGERGLHASVILAQVGSTFVMSVLRTCLRTERMAPDENKLQEQQEIISYKQQELDCFAFHLAELESFDLVAPQPSQAQLHSSDDRVNHIIHIRAQLAQLTSKENTETDVAWDDMPIRKVARSLAQTIESTMDLLSSWDADFDTTFEFQLAFECIPASQQSTPAVRRTYSIGLKLGGDTLRWKVNANELEAIVGLWTWSLFKTDSPGRNWATPLNRLVGLDTIEAGKLETYLYFHKWIFRQKEARMVSSEMIGMSRRFGFNSKKYPHDQDILVVQTQNELETMVAQDIYINFLRIAAAYLNELGGEVDVAIGSQNSFLAHDSRIDELVHLFESNNLGSREDALLCIVPVLKRHNLLPHLAVNNTRITRRIERYIADGAWERAFSLHWWLTQRSECTDFEHSVYELGYLCRRAMMNSNRHVREQGLRNACALLQSGVRVKFCNDQKASLPATWVQSQKDMDWWTAFARQFGWLISCFSKYVSGANWMQPVLEKYDLPETLDDVGSCTNEAQKAAVFFQDWLASSKNLFIHEFLEDGYEACFEWATKYEQHALLHWLALRWLGLGEQAPGFTRHAWSLAAKYRSRWVLEALRRHCADIETLDENGLSALVERVGYGDVEGTQLLLENGANPNPDGNASSKIPLVVAAHEGFNEIVKLLLAHGANLNYNEHMGCPALIWASSSNHLETVQTLLAHGADIHSREAGDKTLVHSAIENDQAEMVNLLLQHGCDINAQDEDGCTALMYSVIYQSLSTLRLLLDRGADASIQDNDGWTALDTARRLDRPEFVEVLLNKCG